MIDKLKKITVIPYEYIKDFLQINPLFLELEVEKPTFVVGDLHQDENSFFAILEATQFFEKDINLIFLGDYIDRGRNIWLLNKILYLKNEYKDRVFLLRGNHETYEDSQVLPPITDENGFFKQLELFKKQYPQYINDELIEFYKYFFNTLSIGIVLKYKNFRFFLTHANVPRINLGKNSNFTNLEEVALAFNPIGISYINDFLWNDLGNTNYTSEVRYQVSRDEINYFLEKFKCDYIIRAHQYVKEGYRLDDRVITIFSNGIKSPISKEKNINSVYNGIPAIFEIMSGKIYQVDINMKKLIPVHQIFYTSYNKNLFSFPELRKISRLSYLGNTKKLSISDLYTNRKKSFVLKKELSYNDLKEFYGIKVDFKIELGLDYVINKSKSSILLVDGNILKPREKIKIFYPLFVNNIMIEAESVQLSFKRKLFQNYRVKYSDLRKKSVLSGNKFYNKKRRKS